MELKIKRALISVSDKTGLADFAKGLTDFGIKILSTGGTAKALRNAGVDVTDVSTHTGYPEILDGRVKTLHPKIHGALLAKRSNASHMETLKDHGIDTIDMIVVNLYPFKEVVAKDGVTMDEAIENIDIGGPTMLRAGAKNFKDVVVVTDHSDYNSILEEMKSNNGAVSPSMRKMLAVKVFEHTYNYDLNIKTYLESVSYGKS